MHNLQYIFLIFGIIFLFLLLNLLKKYMKNPFAMFAIFPFLGLCMFSYVMFSEHQLKQYYKKAFSASEQIRYCGIFRQWVEVKHQNRNDTVTEKVFYFQNNRQGFLFTNSLKARERFPDLKNLKVNDPICFQFSPKYKDEMDRYILTGFKKQAN